jgi:phage tail-like protein
MAHSSSSLLEYLPALYREDPFTGAFLLAFEKMLIGRQDGVEFRDVGVKFPAKGLEESIAGIATYFDPKQTPEEFLTWLSSWTAFSLRVDLDLTKQRDFIANIIRLYRWRGTKANLQRLLEIFIDGTPIVTEPTGDEFQIGVHSTIGKDTYIGGSPPHFFHVTISLPKATPEVQKRKMATAHALVELEKPAHTHYKLDVIFPGLQIGVHSRVGIDTIIGTEPE